MAKNERKEKGGRGGQEMERKMMEKIKKFTKNVNMTK